MDQFSADWVDHFVADLVVQFARILHTRAKAKVATIADNLATPENESQKSISASQMSYDSRIENLSKLIILLTNEPLYAPNENDLKVVALNTLLNQLKITNTAVINVTTPISNARLNRNKILYLAVTGLYDIQNEVKKYVKSVYGATSPEYKQISNIKFTKAR